MNKQIDFNWHLLDAPKVLKHIKKEDKPIMITWMYVDNIEGEIKFKVGKKYYTYKFNSDVRLVMLLIKKLCKYQPFTALNLAKKHAYKCETL